MVELLGFFTLTALKRRGSFESRASLKALNVTFWGLLYGV